MKLNWWRINGWLWIVFGVYYILIQLAFNDLSGGLILSGINILLGYKLLQKSTVAMWIVLVVSVVSLIGSLKSVLQAGEAINMMFLQSIIASILAIILWKQRKTS